MASSSLTVHNSPLGDRPTLQEEGQRSDVKVTGSLSSVSGAMARSRTAAVEEMLESHRGDRQLVVLQDFPDPDALSSAWAYKLIAAQHDIQCDLVYAGTLSHQENIALVKLTGIPVQRWACQSSKAKARDLSVYQGCVLIDNQGGTSQLMSPVQEAGIPIALIIDHHSPQDDLEAEVIDVRPNTRATATILTQYLQAGLLALDSSVGDHVKCATALMHGIRSDTHDLRQAQEEDFQAAAYL
ncbi:MAG: DHH family phosphoesterase, partial [Thermosynechococcaceae cyanobacterium]